MFANRPIHKASLASSDAATYAALVVEVVVHSWSFQLYNGRIHIVALDNLSLGLPRDSEKAIKEAATEPMLRDPRKVGHVFTPETLQKTKIGGGDFLLPAEEKQFKEMLIQYSLSLIFRGILSRYPCLGLESLNF